MFLGILSKRHNMEPRADGQFEHTRAAALFWHRPRQGRTGAWGTCHDSRFCSALGGLWPGSARSGVARPRCDRAENLAPVFHLGNHPLPHSGGGRPFPARAASEPRPATGAPRTPPGARKWFSLDEVLRLQGPLRHRRIKRPSDYLPYQARGRSGEKWSAVANFKGGVGKTSTAVRIWPCRRPLTAIGSWWSIWTVRAP